MKVVGDIRLFDGLELIHTPGQTAGKWLRRS
jgi:hypothetical protein